MHHHWQDIVLAIAILGFNIALLPSVFSQHKPDLRTSALTAFFQTAILVVYISLSLWYSAAMSFVNASLWAILAVQRQKRR